MSLNYTTYTNQIANLMAVQQTTDTNFQTFLPGCIDYAEQRIYRETDLVTTRITDATGALAAGNRNFTLPTSLGIFLVVESFNVISPAGTPAASGTRNPLTYTSRDFIDAVYPDNTTITGIPAFFANATNLVPTGTNMTMIVGPSPSAAYSVEIVGTQRPTPLSATNTTTILSIMLPDLLIAASMVFASGYMRDFGAQSDNPQMAQSWEAQYGKLIQSANVEELRKQYQSQGWTSKQPSPAQPPRT